MEKTRLRNVEKLRKRSNWKIKVWEKTGYEIGKNSAFRKAKCKRKFSPSSALLSFIPDLFRKVRDLFQRLQGLSELS
ncbi:TPA: hypothetical protein HA351_02875 [Methanosarcinaceae archaeon]|nr:hypothetical protein [Methanosarcinaceae archaeon]